MTLYTRDGSQPRFRAHGFDEKSGSIAFVFQDITNWTEGTEHISGLEIVFKTPDHIIERWKTRKPGGTETAFEFELHRKGA